MSTILTKTQTIIAQKLGSDLNTNFLYHNLRHTQRVVNAVKELCKDEEVSEKETQQLLLAAWFHDVGHTVSHKNHEEHGVQMAQDLFTTENLDAITINEVARLIRATKIGHEPIDLLEKIMKDADSCHFSKKNFSATMELHREELSLLGIAEYTVQEWRKKHIELLRTQHRFYTDFATEQWQGDKDANVKKLLKARSKHKKLVKKESLKAKFKGQLPDRGIQTLYRVTLRNHLKLSDIADTKANILLSVNAIIISLALSNLIPKLDNPSNDYLIYPTFAFIFFSIIAMVMSILATRPNVTSGRFTTEDVRKKSVNLLFFGNFHRMDLKPYQWAMRELIKDKDYIYDSLTMDLYYLGVVLERKYRILRWTYTVFMIGMILSVIVFAIALKFYGPDRVLDLPELS